MKAIVTLQLLTCTCTLYPHVDYPHQYGYTPLHLAARKGNITCVERLLCTPGIDVNIRAGRVSQSTESS